VQPITIYKEAKMIVEGAVIIINTYPMMTIIVRKAPILEVEHDDNDVRIWRFITDRCAIIDSKDPMPNRKVKVMMRNMIYLPRTH